MGTQAESSLKKATGPLLLACEALRTADALLVTAGAGMGVDSGLPDFRGRQGFWRAYPVFEKMGIPFEQAANPSWFDEEPGLAWAFYGHRLNLYRRTEPHTGFRQLLEIGSLLRHGVFVFTSNVDGQFQKSGYATGRIVECHGSIHHLQCSRRCTPRIWEAPSTPIDINEVSFRARLPLPQCPHCGALARPNVLMFGDWNWVPDRTALQEARLADWIGAITAGSSRLVIVECGAGTGVPTVRATSERLARMTGGVLVRINTREPAVPPGHIALPMGAADAIAAIHFRIQPEPSGMS